MTTTMSPGGTAAPERTGEAPGLTVREFVDWVRSGFVSTALVTATARDQYGQGVTVKDLTDAQRALLKAAVLRRLADGYSPLPAVPVVQRPDPEWDGSCDWCGRRPVRCACDRYPHPRCHRCDGFSWESDAHELWRANMPHDPEALTRYYAGRGTWCKYESQYLSAEARKARTR